LGFLVTAEEQGALTGFAVGCTDGKALMRIVKKRLLKFLLIMLPRILRQPGLINRVWQTTRYGENSLSDVPAELLIIAVDEPYRGQGVGQALVGRLEAEFRAKRIMQYKVTVHADNARANMFYQTGGMSRAGSFSLYQVLWNVYRKNLN
jgi:GNAT superfamily N-acetyltransferase